MKICNNCVHLGKQKTIHSYVCINSKSKQFKVPFPHGQTRKACNQYKSRQSPHIDLSQIQIKGMKFIEDYRDKFQGSDIWVIGCDPNLDYYSDNFFDDKISITLNYACIAFPNSTYFTFGGGNALPIIKSRMPHFFKKCILPLSLEEEKDTTIWWENWGLDIIYMKLWSGKSTFDQTKSDFEETTKQIFSDGPCTFIPAMSTADYGTQIAAVLGAKRIILVGCSATVGDAQKRGLSEFYGNNREGLPVGWLIGQHPHQIQMRQSTVRFAEIFRKYDVEIIKHRFDEEEGKFIFVEVKSERNDLWDVGWGMK